MFNKKKKAKPEINTTALPDIIFMLLFFFMVVTVMRQKPIKVRVDLPAAERLVKLKHPSIHHHIYVGTHPSKNGVNKGAIQLNDKFVKLDQIEKGVRLLVRAQSEDLQSQINTCLHADEELEMDILAKVKTELRKADQRNLAYIAKEKK